LRRNESLTIRSVARLPSQRIRGGPHASDRISDKTPALHAAAACDDFINSLNTLISNAAR
jgi:hypothetical protein